MTYALDDYAVQRLSCGTCNRRNGFYDVRFCDACGASYCVDEHNQNSFTDPPEAPCMADHGCPGYGAEQ